MKNKFTVMICIILLSLNLAGCDKNKEKKTLVVFAAASLTESMKEIEITYEKMNPLVDIVLNIDGSSRLRTQIEKGIDANIYLSANKKHIDILVDKGLTFKEDDFVKNKMILVTPKDSIVKTLDDLKKECALVIAQEHVPAGEYALKIIGNIDTESRDDILNNIVSKENNVKHVLAKVILQEADAAFVYASDITDSIRDKVNTIEIPKEINLQAQYGACILSEDKESIKLYEYIMGNEGKEIFYKYGFEM